MVEYEARGITVRDVAPAVFIEAYALHLKNSDRFEIPKWTDLVKTGVHKELGPTDDDWYFVRAASIARKVYLKPGVGVGAQRHERELGSVGPLDERVVLRPQLVV